MTPPTNIPTPRTAAMLASVQGGRIAGTDDGVTAEEDYYDKSLKLLKELERENVVLRLALQGLVDGVNEAMDTKWNGPYPIPKCVERMVAAQKALTPPITR